MKGLGKFMYQCLIYEFSNGNSFSANNTSNCDYFHEKKVGENKVFQTLKLQPILSKFKVESTAW